MWLWRVPVLSTVAQLADAVDPLDQLTIDNNAITWLVPRFLISRGSSRRAPTHRENLLHAYNELSAERI